MSQIVFSKADLAESDKNLFKLHNLSMEKFHTATNRIAKENQSQYYVEFITLGNETVKMRKYSTKCGLR